MSFETVTQQIESLPALNASIQRIQALFREEDVDIKKLSKAIESDSLLTANLLAIINEPKYGFSKKIGSIHQAVMLFGTRMVRGFILSISMQQNFRLNLSPYGLSNAHFNDICHLQSALMFQWYMRIDIRNAQDLVAISLIMEMGKVILAKELAESSYSSAFYNELAAGEDIGESEKLYADTTSYFISGLLFEHWNFDEKFVQSMKALDFPENATLLVEDFIKPLDVIRTAINVREVLTPQSIQAAMVKVKEMGQDEQLFKSLAMRVKRNFEESAS